MNDDFVHLLSLLRKRRLYAGFFDFPHKETKELGIAQELVDSLNREKNLGLSGLRVHRPDPPDVTCLNTVGEPIAIEVSEVVCEDTVRRNAKGQKKIRYWQPGELAS